MKKKNSRGDMMTRMNGFVLILAALLVVAAMLCQPVPSYAQGGYAGFPAPVSAASSATPMAHLSPEKARELVEAKALGILFALRNNDLCTLSGYVHPKAGLRFLPGSKVNADRDLTIRRASLKEIMTIDPVFNWGYDSKTGKAIEVPFSEYYKGYVYPRDFFQADKIAFNEPLVEGRDINKLLDSLSAGIVAGYAVQHDGEWEAVNLIFKKFAEDWFLVGIAHDQWP